MFHNLEGFCNTQNRKEDYKVLLFIIYYHGRINYQKKKYLQIHSKKGKISVQKKIDREEGIFMAIERTWEPTILYESDRYTLFAQDKSENYSTIRSIMLCMGERTFEIGKYEKNIIAGEHTFCEFNDQYVAIISENRYTRREKTIQTLFDLQNQKFLVGEQDILMQIFLESEKSENKQKRKVTGCKLEYIA